jgi:hypothetical protein
VRVLVSLQDLLPVLAQEVPDGARQHTHVHNLNNEHKQKKKVKENMKGTQF